MKQPIPSYSRLGEIKTCICERVTAGFVKNVFHEVIDVLDGAAAVKILLVEQFEKTSTRVDRRTTRVLFSVSISAANSDTFIIHAIKLRYFAKSRFVYNLFVILAMS